MTRSRRIGYVLLHAPRYSETFIEAEIRAVRAAGAAVETFVARPPGGGPRRDLGRVVHALLTHPLGTLRHMRLLGPSNWPRSLVASAHASALRAEVRRFAPDVLHAHFVNLPTAVAVLLGRDLAVPVTATAHAADYVLDRHPAALDRRLNRLAHLFLISASAAGQLAQRGVRMAWIPHSVVRASFDGTLTADRTPTGDGVARLVTVARLIEKKGVDTALDAVARLVRAGRPVRYDIYGDGPLRAVLERSAAAAGIAQAVTFHGAVPHSTAMAALRTADVAVLPCRRASDGDLDGIPVFLMEAAGRGVPVASTPVSGIPELVGPDEGWLVPPADPDALAWAIAEALDDPALARRRAAGLRQRVATEFAPATQAARLLDTWSAHTDPDRLTVVCTYFPLPADRGDPVRVLMMLQALAQVCRYTLLVVRRPTTTDDELDRLRELLPGVTVRAYDATPYRLGRLGPAGRYGEARTSGVPPWVRTRYSRTLHDDLRTRSGAGLAIGEAAGAYFPNTRLRWHWDKANVLAASTRQDVSEARGLAHRLRARYLASASRRFEGRALSRAASVSVTSAAEGQRLFTEYRRRADATLPSCVPFPQAHQPTPRERTLLWLGAFEYRPNVLGLLRFLDEGWPALHRAGWTLTLIGSGHPPPVVSTHDGVRCLGYQADLAPALAPARAAVVPLWTGAGVKLKTLTLLAHSLPVFSTSVGAEGVPESAAVRVAETPAALAEAILATRTDQFDVMAAEAAALVRREFSAESFAERLIAALTRTGHLTRAAVPARTRLGEG